MLSIKPIAHIYSEVMAALELRHLRYLIAVAERGNFTRAAEELGMTQAAVSYQIKILEERVGADGPRLLRVLFSRGSAGADR